MLRMKCNPTYYVKQRRNHEHTKYILEVAITYHYGKHDYDVPPERHRWDMNVIFE